MRRRDNRNSGLTRWCATTYAMPRRSQKNDGGRYNIINHSEKPVSPATTQPGVASNLNYQTSDPIFFQNPATRFAKPPAERMRRNRENRPCERTLLDRQSHNLGNKWTHKQMLDQNKQTVDDLKSWFASSSITLEVDTPYAASTDPHKPNVVHYPSSPSSSSSLSTSSSSSKRWAGSRLKPPRPHTASKVGSRGHGYRGYRVKASVLPSNVPPPKRKTAVKKSKQARISCGFMEYKAYDTSFY